jgi:hypothetical protein
MPPLVLSSDSHVFEPPDLWQTRIDRAFRDRAPRIERIDDADQIVVEADQILSGIGLISNAGFTRAPALRRVRVRAVLGRRRGARPAAEPAHGDAPAGQDPRRRRQHIARRQQPRDKGVLSGAVAVRSDLLRRLRASSPTGRASTTTSRARHQREPSLRRAHAGQRPQQQNFNSLSRTIAHDLILRRAKITPIGCCPGF